MKEKTYQENLNKVREMLSNYTDISSDDINLDSQLIFDLGLTSFDFMCLAASLESEIGRELDSISLKNLKTVRDLCELYC